jgi:hypothetical protein
MRFRQVAAHPLVALLCRIVSHPAPLAFTFLQSASRIQRIRGIRTAIPTGVTRSASTSRNVNNPHKVPLSDSIINRNADFSRATWVREDDSAPDLRTAAFIFDASRTHRHQSLPRRFSVRWPEAFCLCDRSGILAK